MIKNDYFLKRVILLSLVLPFFSMYTYAQVSGTVFRDFNSNGTKDNTTTFNEMGLAGVTITAYDATGNSVGTATSAADGTYTIAGVSGTLRIEFTNFPTANYSSPAGNTSVQFVTAPISAVNFGVILPSLYVDETPVVTTTTFYPYAHTGVNSWRKSLITVTPDGGVTGYDPTGPCPTGNDSPAVDTSTLFSQIGTCFGLGYQAKNKTLFAGTYVKQFSDIGPQGTGAIYRIDMSDENNPVVLNGTPNTATGPIDLNLIFGANTCGTNPFANAPSTGSYPNYNQLSDRVHVADAVYNTAFSDIDVSHDQSNLYALSFSNYKLYKIPINGSTITSSNVTAIDLPIPSGKAFSEMRATGMGVHANGKVYVVVQGNFILNSPENNTDVDYLGGTARYHYLGDYSIEGSAFYAIYEYDPQANSFNTTPIISFNNRQADLSWIDYDTPMFRDLVFDDQDAIILGGRILRQDLNGGTTGSRLLRFYKHPTTGVYTMEANSSVYSYHINGTVTTPGNPEYGTDKYQKFYYQTKPVDGGLDDSNGGLAQIMGRNSIVETMYDGCAIHTAGIRTLSHDDGTSVRYQTTLQSLIYLDGTNGVIWDNKRGVLGDLEVVSSPPPLEIGNRVWTDTDEDGIQDANEAGIDGITVLLFEGSTQVGTTTTTNGGQWYFNDSNTTGGLKPNTAYTVRVLSSAFPSGQSLTLANNDGSTNGDVRDNDAALVSGNAEIAYTTGDYGENDHTLDMGFRAAIVLPPLPPTTNCCAAPVADVSANGDFETSTTSVFNQTIGGLPASGLSSTGTDPGVTGNTAVPTNWFVDQFTSGPSGYPADPRGIYYIDATTNKFVWIRRGSTCLSNTASFTANLEPCRQYKICLQAAGWSPYGTTDNISKMEVDVVGVNLSGSGFINFNEDIPTTTDISAIQWQTKEFVFSTESTVPTWFKISLSTGLDDNDGVIYDNFQICDMGPATGNGCAATCSLTVDSAVPSTCDPATNTYSLAVAVTYANPPSGDITINVGGTDYTFTPDGTSPDTYTILGLISDGVQNIDVTATFVGDNACTDDLLAAYDAPASCFCATSTCLLSPSFFQDIVLGFDGTLYTSEGTANNGACTVDGSYDMTMDASGNIYVTSSLNNTVLKFDNAGNCLGTFVTAGSGGLDNPRGLTFLPNGDLLVNSHNSGQILRYNGTTGAYIGVFSDGSDISPIASMAPHMSIKYGPDGAVWVADHTNNRILRFDATTGAFLSVFAQLPSGSGVRSFEFFGNYVLISRHNVDIVAMYNYNTGAYITDFADSADGLDGPTGITYGPDGKVYIGSLNNNQILVFDASGTLETTISVNSPKDILFKCGECFAAPCSLTVDSAVPTACNPADNTYSLAVAVTYANPPNGDITINVGGTDYTFTPDGTSPDTYTVTGLTSNGTTAIDVSATFVGDAACTHTLVDAYNAPASCSCNLTATATGTPVSCNGGSDGTASATPSGNTGSVTYLWSNGETTSSISGLTAGTYTVTVTESATCTAVAIYDVTQPPLMDITCTKTDVTTNGGNDGSASVNATGGTSPYTYLWNSGETTSSISGKTAGTYTVTVTDDNGCTAICNSTIQEPGCNLSATATGTPVSCNGGNDGTASATPSGNIGAVTYLWSNSETTASINGLTAGTYTVTVTESAICTAVAIYDVTQPPLMDITCTKTDVTTNGGSDGTASVNATGGTSPYTYLWSSGETTSSISGKTSGTYTVTVTDDNGCTAMCNSTINEPGALCNLTAAGLGNVMCNNNGTNADASDDYISFTLNPTGTTLGSNYVVTVSSGSVTPTSASYGQATTFQLQNGSAGSGNTVTITITDLTDTNCKIQVDIP
ncbi:MAG: hypothetical protein JNM36_06785, partial [Chitinophagales bacterium]|nr:hypothetical protein [Chitinophagales bacterium]